MAAANKFQIENGVVAWCLVADGDDPSWQAPGGKDADEVSETDYVAPTGLAFSCQVQSGMLTASPNTSDNVTDPTFCEPEITTVQVGVTGYALELTALQDPHIADGMSYFSFKNDTRLAYFVLGLNTWGAPKAIGKCRIVAGTFGGGARADLTTDIACPVEVKPDIQFGSGGGWTIVYGNGDPDKAGTDVPVVNATTATETPGGEGSWDPAGSTPPSTVTDLVAGIPNPIAASPTTAWTAASYIQTQELGPTGQAYWDGTTWVAGVAPGAATAAAGRASSGK